jgi:hypothetical protein
MIVIPLSIEKCIFACWFSTISVPSWSCTPIKSDLYFDISSASVLSEPALYRLLTFHVPNHMSILFSLGRLSRNLSRSEALCVISYQAYFLREELLGLRPTPKLEAHLLSAVCDSLLNVLAATLHIWRLSPPYAAWGHAMPLWQENHLTWIYVLYT